MIHIFNGSEILHFFAEPDAHLPISSVLRDASEHRTSLGFFDEVALWTQSDGDVFATHWSERFEELESYLLLLNSELFFN